MQNYDGLVFGSAIVLVCMYVFLGTQIQSRALTFASPAIVGVLVFLYSILPGRVIG